MDFLLDEAFHPLPSSILVGRDTYIASYDLNLVALSVVIATLAGMVALTIGARLTQVEGRWPRFLWLGAGSTVMAGGIWAMHFVGMLAFSLPCAVNYDLSVTMLSTIPAWLASFAALAVSSRSDSMSSWQVAVAGLVMGLGIGAMHYTGMAAMRMEAILVYDPLLVLVSVAVAGGLACASLALNVRLVSGERRTRIFDQRRLPAALFMGIAVAGMHYTAMAAAIFVPDPSPSGDPLSVSPDLLALLITVVTTAVIAATLAIVFGSVQRETAGILREAVRSREAAEMAAEERGKRLQAILDNLAEGIVSISEDGRILHWSPSAERLFGYTAAEVEGRNVACLMPEPYASQHDGYLAAYWQTGVANVIGRGRKVAGRRKDGSVFPLYLAVGRADLETGTVFTGILRDLSAEEAAQAEVRTKQHQLRVALDSMADGLCMVDVDGRIVVANDTFADLMGVAPESLMRGAQSVYPVSDLENRFETVELTIGRQSIELQITPTDDGGHVLLAHDISQRKQTEQDLRSARDRAELATRAKSAFLANMSHEIRTPMNSVLGFISLTLEETGLSAEVRRHLKVADRSARALLQIINDILDVSKLESGAVVLELMPVSVSECLRGVQDLLALKAREKGLELSLEIDPAVPEWVSGDPTRLRQILLNIVGNAVKFTDRGSVQVSVTLEPAGADDDATAGLRFAVADTGPGIAPDRLDSIFEPFSQEDESTTRRFGGSGLGTTICRQLVDLMGGRIWAENRPGGGALFTFVLPLQPSAPPVAPTWMTQRAAVRRTFRILVVEDVAENRLLLELRLRRLGHQVFLAENGAEGLAMFSTLAPDIVLMDVHMPVMDGLAATAAIRRAEAAGQVAGDGDEGPQDSTPIIALTASVMEEDQAQCLAAGMDVVVAKPVDFPTLIRQMERLALPERGQAESSLPPAEQAAPAQPVAVPPELQVLEEVADLPAGMRAWQSSTAYADALQGFAGRVDDWQMVARATDDRDFRSARAVLHTLKGLAGNLALTTVADIANRFGALLKGCADGDPVPEEAAGLQEELRLALTAVGQALRRLKRPQVEPDRTDAAGQQPDIATALEDLMAALGNDNPDPVERELARMEGILPPGVLDPVARAVEEFDFELARERLRELMDAEGVMP
ncbi:MHYT domain-containing protein [Marinibaculum pumilum]|uniref:histidine kinase n=1 Tax=Marinibaculum pumilum TaxID=1766165 RepID=A0ABV7L1S7_9PROT